MRFLIEALIPLLLGVEVIIPLWRNRTPFPLVRGMGRGLRRLTKAHPAELLDRSAEERLRVARLRAIAADKDRKAALLEKQAEQDEEEANRLRIGDIEE